MIYLKDTIKEGMRQRFDQLRAMGIRTVMITGDNRLTAAKIAEESGVDDFLAEATPEAKLALIQASSRPQGRLVAMTGDGTNDAPALAQADVGVAMNTGTQAAREAGNMVDLDSNPTKLIEIVEVGKQLLITRGALTTFSIANDVAKYFAILPAIFLSTYAATKGGQGPLHVLNIMNLGTPSLGGDLGDRVQRDRDPAADPAGAARRALPADRGQRAAAAQPVDLRPGRPHRPVHRDQADRPHRPQPAGGIGVPGRHKVFLGMAAGVGKTYRMLQEGRAEAEAGRDVVIGYLEPHGRAETVAQADGLELVTRRQLRYRDTVLAEMDLPAILRRAPELCLIDELAHTNAPGTEHPKRYQDVADVLAAGIDVFSTVNVQHLESLNDQVAELTGTRVRETLPDSVLSDADDVVLIDITPESLIERLQAGKVYPAERIPGALNNFFKLENLSALREVALRQVAEEIEAKRSLGGEPGTGGGRFRGREERLIDGAAPQAIGERLLALASPQPSAQRVVRRAWRSAQRLGAELDVLWVADDDTPGEAEREQLAALRRLTSVLGAHLLVERGDDVAAIVRAGGARARHHLRADRRARAAQRLATVDVPALPAQLLSALPGVDLRIVANRTERRAAGDR